MPLLPSNVKLLHEIPGLPLLGINSPASLADCPAPRVTVVRFGQNASGGSPDSQCRTPRSGRYNFPTCPPLTRISFLHAAPPGRLITKGENMKTITRILSAALLLLLTATPLLADGGSPRPPFCYPGTTCGLHSSFFDGGDPRPPACWPGIDCGLNLSRFDGNPRPPFCYPGTTCGLHSILLDGSSPRPYCFPGVTCSMR